MHLTTCNLGVLTNPTRRRTRRPNTLGLLLQNLFPGINMVSRGRCIPSRRGGGPNTQLLRQDGVTCVRMRVVGRPCSVFLGESVSRLQCGGGQSGGGGGEGCGCCQEGGEDDLHVASLFWRSKRGESERKTMMITFNSGISFKRR